MAGMNLEIGGDASGALGALAATQAAIDALHGKSVEVDVAVNGGGGATDSLGRVKEGAEEAGKAHDQHTASLGRNRDALEKASAGAREHASATERGTESLKEHGQATERANDGLNRNAEAHDRATSSLRQHSEAAAQNNAAAGEATGAWNRALEASRAYTDERSRVKGLGNDATEADKESLRTLGRQYTSARDDLRSAIGDSQFNQQWASSVIRGSAPQAPTSSLQREDLPSPSAVERAEALRSATQRLDAAQTQAAATAVAYRKAFDEAFEEAPAGVNATESATQATRSLRSDMDDARNTFRSASRDVSDLEKAFGTAEQGGADFGEAFDKVSGPLQMAGMGALVATAGIGLLGTATAALGAGSALESIRQTPGLMYQAQLATRDFDKAFQQMNQASLQAGMPGMKDLQQSLGGLGHIAAQIGVDQLPNVLKDANTLVHDFGSMAQQLEPAMKPAEDAATSLFGAIMGGIGGAAPAIAAFSNTLSASGPQIQEFTTGAVNAMSGIGRLTVDTADTFAKPMDVLGNLASSTADFVEQTPNTPESSPLGQAARAVASYLPVLGTGLNAYDMATGGGSPSGSDQAMQLGTQLGAHYADTNLPAPWYPDASGSLSTTPSTPSQLTPSQLAGQPQTPVAPSQNPLLPQAQQAQQLADNLQNVQQASTAANQSLSQIGSSAAPSLQQVGQAAQQVPAQLNQPLQQAAQQVPQSLAPLQPALQQALQPPPPPNLAQPVQQAASAATAQVQQATPSLQSASQDLGSSIPTGAAAGITKDEDVPVTIVRHLIEKIITEGSDSLDSHSPSRVFETLGTSIPQGLAVGIQSQTNLPVAATQQMIQQVAQGAQNSLSGQQNPLNPNQGAQQAQAQAAQQQAQQQALQNSLSGFPGGYGQTPQTQAQLQQREAQQKAQDAQEKAQLANSDLHGLSPDLQNKIRSQGDLNDADKAQLGTVQQRRQELDKFGWKDSTEDRVLDRDQKYAAEFAHKKELQQSGKAQAKDELRHPNDAMRKFLGLGSESKEDGEQEGKSRQLGVASGIRNAQGSVDQATGDSADSSINLYKKKHGISSPATVWSSIGANLMAGVAEGIYSGGGSVSDALTAASAGIQATANNNGLQVGYGYADNIVTGMQTVIKQADFQSSAIPQLASALATTALGQLGDLGPAGGAGQIPKNLQVALSGGVPAQQTPVIQNVVQVKVSLDGQPFDQKVATAINDAFGSFGDHWQQN